MPDWDTRFDLPLRTADQRLITALARAEALASVISGIYLPPLERSRLDRLNIVRTVHATTAIEGNDLDEGQVAQVVDAAAPARWQDTRQREVREAKNAAQVMDLIAGILQEEPTRLLTEDLICRLNERLTQDIEYQNHTPGRYRRHGVTAGTFVPPRSPDRVRALMAQFITWPNGETSSWHPIARALAAHFYFVSIHPFGDGNGRTARAVESFLLYQAGINAFGFYSLANFYYKDRDEYIARLTQAREQRDLTIFVRYAAEGLAAELTEVHAEVLAYLSRLAFRDHIATVLRRERLSAKTRERLSEFMEILGHEVVSTADIREGTHPLGGLYRRTSSRTMERDIAFLERAGLIERDGHSLGPNLAALRGPGSPKPAERRYDASDRTGSRRQLARSCETRADPNS